MKNGLIRKRDQFTGYYKKINQKNFAIYMAK